MLAKRRVYPNSGIAGNCYQRRLTNRPESAKPTPTVIPSLVWHGAFPTAAASLPTVRAMQMLDGNTRQAVRILPGRSLVPPIGQPPGAALSH